jgi:hypothetical protein
MIKSKVYPNLLSFVTIRRGNWVMKISVFKSKWVLIIAQHYFDKDCFHMRQFANHNEAADFIEFLVSKDNDES